MRKEDIRGVYDGSIFYKKAREYENKKGETQKQKYDGWIGEKVRQLL